MAGGSRLSSPYPVRIPPVDIDMARTRISHPSGVESPVRFVVNNGTAAAWSDTSRVLYATGTLVRPPTARLPWKFTTDSGDEWEITRLAGGGCGCKKRNSPLGQLSAAQLTDPDFSEVA